MSRIGKIKYASKKNMNYLLSFLAGIGIGIGLDQFLSTFPVFFLMMIVLWFIYLYRNMNKKK
ncbi:MAG TPA: hypothetical protein DHW82_06530 [Spirochaetia bacterium]|nr:MAG: hypothetical protein A2Y41_03090 [Spirochaetes bacterium GWB1_36_13]HCL56649.1 hypothetical protein [Spirochaetia bacterium]